MSSQLSTLALWPPTTSDSYGVSSSRLSSKETVQAHRQHKTQAQGSYVRYKQTSFVVHILVYCEHAWCEVPAHNLPASRPGRIEFLKSKAKEVATAMPALPQSQWLLGLPGLCPNPPGHKCGKSASRSAHKDLRWDTDCAMHPGAGDAPSCS